MTAKSKNPLSGDHVARPLTGGRLLADFGLGHAKKPSQPDTTPPNPACFLLVVTDNTSLHESDLVTLTAFHSRMGYFVGDSCEKKADGAADVRPICLAPV